MNYPALDRQIPVRRRRFLAIALALIPWSLGCASTRTVTVRPNEGLDPDKLRQGTHIVAYVTADSVRHPFVGYAYMTDAETWRLTPQERGRRSVDLPQSDILALEIEGSGSLTPDRPVPPSRAWYGASMLIVDASSWAALATLLATTDDDNAAYAIAGAGYLVGGPTVHFLRGNSGRAAGSLGLRVGCAAIGGAVLALGTPICFEGPCHDTGSDAGYYVGAGILLVTAQLVDDLILARDDRMRGDWRYVAVAPMRRDGRFEILFAATHRF